MKRIARMRQLDSVCVVGSVPRKISFVAQHLPPCIHIGVRRDETIQQLEVLATFTPPHLCSAVPHQLRRHALAALHTRGKLQAWHAVCLEPSGHPCLATAGRKAGRYGNSHHERLRHVMTDTTSHETCQQEAVSCTARTT
jgi:hypothetical protein